MNKEGGLIKAYSVKAIYEYNYQYRIGYATSPVQKPIEETIPEYRPIR
jgi:hypothetical protein